MEKINKNDTLVIPNAPIGVIKVGNSIAVTNKLLSESKYQFFGDFSGKTIFIIKEEYKKGLDIFFVSQFINEKNVMISVSESIKIYNSKQECIYKENIIRDSQIHSVIWNNNLLIFHNNGLVTFLNLINGAKKNIHLHHNHHLSTVSVSPDDQYIVTGYIPGHIIVWDPNTFSIIKSFYYDKGISKILFDHANQNQLIINSFENQITVWDLNKLIITKYFNEHSNMVQSMNYNHRKNILASCSYDNTLKIYDYENQKSFLTFNFDETIVELNFSDDGNLLGIVLFSGIAKIYETKNFSLLFTYEKQKTDEIQRTVNRGILFTDDNYVITTSSVDGSIHKWK